MPCKRTCWTIVPLGAAPADGMLRFGDGFALKATANGKELYLQSQRYTMMNLNCSMSTTGSSRKQGACGVAEQSSQTVWQVVLLEPGELVLEVATAVGTETSFVATAMTTAEELPVLLIAAGCVHAVLQEQIVHEGSAGPLTVTCYAGFTAAGATTLSPELPMPAEVAAGEKMFALVGDRKSVV